MSVRELVDVIDNSLVLELYGYDESRNLQHRGTFNLNVPTSKSSLLEQCGNCRVKHKDVYKAYVLVYLDE